MKITFFAMVTVLLLTSVVSADTLTLTDPSLIVIPPDTHADIYEFPELLESDNPMVTLAIDYDGSTDYDGLNDQHGIVSTHILFDPNNVDNIDVLVENQNFLEALVTFSIPVTDIDGFGAGFLAIHENTGGCTEIIWTATYADGSVRTSSRGIIPEPASSAIFGFVMLAGSTMRRRQRS